MSEVTDSFSGRPVLVKHKGYAYFHPSAFCAAQITADIPVLLFQISIFSLVVYFMVGLEMSAGAFFTYWIIVFATTMVRSLPLYSNHVLIISVHDGSVPSSRGHLSNI